MLTFHQSEIDLILSGISAGKTDSDLGFFSKPFSLNYNNQELIIKMYHPTKNYTIVAAIIDNHDRYIAELRSMGIKLPDTIIRSRKIKNKYQIIIIQEAFRKSELLRSLIEKSPEPELLNLCKLILDDTMKFWKDRKESADIGFHPTLRNYALRKGDLYYFDTFPPMLLKQRELNKIIIRMSPFGKLFKIFIPLRMINFVSDEYYNFQKMFTGIVGSCCRLRPQNASEILNFSRRYIDNTSRSAQEKQNIINALQSPPNLPRLWTFFRSLSGNVGKPNIKT